jgi:hypothetical protein
VTTTIVLVLVRLPRVLHRSHWSILGDRGYTKNVVIKKDVTGLQFLIINGWDRSYMQVLHTLNSKRPSKFKNQKKLILFVKSLTLCWGFIGNLLQSIYGLPAFHSKRSCTFQSLFAPQIHWWHLQCLLGISPLSCLDQASLLFSGAAIKRFGKWANKMQNITNVELS